ncbi:MAG: winged helix-turn-helix domain-containing protein [Alphaproteobacteria bacterium]|nr:winged helix-turn-helix domain-containing protein [Alphaproteobacteria bacterium]
MLPLTCGSADLLRGWIDRHDGTRARLTSTERALLAYLAERPGRDLTRAELLAQVWGYAPGVSTRALDTAVKVLRRKIEADPQCPEHLLTVWGVGYRFEPFRAASTGDLVGRSVELAAIRSALRGGVRVVTLWGPAGIGKTRLARQAVADLEGVIVSLTGITDRDLVQAVDLALPDLSDAPLEHRLAQRPRLVVLDHADHLRDAIRASVPGWLRAAPGLQLVVTTRVQLELGEERQIEVGPLKLSDGAALFRRRLAQARREEVDEPEEQVSALVEALGGLPVALELAAVRGAVLGLEELLRRGPSRLDPTGTVGSLLRSSVALLDPDAARVLSACLVFRSTFGAVHVEVAVPDHPDPIGALQRLMAASLLQRTPGGDLAMIPVVREALPALLGPPDPAVRRRVASLLVDLAERSEVETQQWLFDLRAVAESEDLPPDLRARAGLRYVDSISRRSAIDRSDEVARVRAHADASGNPVLIADTAVLACAVALRNGPRHREMFEAAVRLARATGDRARVGWALSHLGTFERLSGEGAAAITTLEEAEVEAASGPAERMGLILAERALARRATGDVLGAIDDLERALPFAVKAGDTRYERVIRTRLGTTLAYLGRSEAAAVHDARALELAERGGLGPALFEVRASSVVGALFRGDADGAWAHVTWCLLHPQLGSPFHLSMLHAEAATLAVHRGDLALAAHHAAQAVVMAMERPGSVSEGRAYLADGVWRTAAGDPGARTALLRAARIAPGESSALYARGFLALLPDADPDELRSASEAARGSDLMDLVDFGRALVEADAPAVGIYGQVARKVHDRRRGT